ncbi:hypothetical protein CKQ90_36625, partial [Klebsiella pneumoniae]
LPPGNTIYDQLHPGQFRGEFTEILLDEIQVFREPLPPGNTIYDQLHPGQFRGEFTEILLDEIQVFRE